MDNTMARTVTVIEASKNLINDERIRVAAYCRVSTDKDDQVNSFLTQMKYYNDYIKSNPKMRLIDIYADLGITGTLIKKRDEFKRLMKDCQNRKIDRVLVKSVTRFARNSLECIEAVRELKSYGVSVYFENDNIDTEKMNSEMLLYIKSAFAQNESMSSSKRMVTSIKMRMEDGTYKLGIAPYGYKLVDGELKIVPEEAKNIRKIFDLYLQGVGSHAIVKYMQTHYKEELDWNIGRINYILENERYLGDMMMRKTYTPNILPLRNRPNKGQEDRYYYEGTHEAIITKEEWEKVLEIKRQRAGKFKKTNGEKRFFSKRIKCRHCGWSFRPIERNGETFWRCSKKGLTVELCPSPCYSEKQIKDTFIGFYNKLKQNEKNILDDTITQLQLLKARINRGNNEIADIDKEMAVLCSKNSMYESLYQSGSFDEIIYFEKVDAIKKRISDLKIRRLKLIAEDDNEKVIDKLKNLKRILGTYPEIITQFDEQLYSKIIKCLYVEEDGKLTFELDGELELSMEVV